MQPFNSADTHSVVDVRRPSLLMVLMLTVLFDLRHCCLLLVLKLTVLFMPVNAAC